MANLSSIIRPDKARSDGSCRIYLLLTHNSGCKRIPTELFVDSAQNFRGGVVVKQPNKVFLNTKIDQLITSYQDAIDEVGYIDGLTCSELYTNICTVFKSKNRSLRSLFDEYISSARLKQSSISAITSMFNSIERYFGGDFLVARLNHAYVMAFEKACRDTGCSMATVRAKVVCLQSIVTYATRCGYVTYKIHPFCNYKLPSVAVRDCWLDVNSLRSIRDERMVRATAKCRDIFMLSFYLGGINAADLVRLDFKECIKTKCVRYVRVKTETREKVNKEVEFALPNEARVLMKQLMGADGYINVSQYERDNNLHYLFNRSMKKVGERAGVDNLIYYAARKTFAQIAFNLGISTSVIDYILGHKLDKGGTSLYAYISVTPKIASEAMRKVLDFVK